MTCYYNENDPFAADWLEQLIAAGHLPSGEVDRRSIEEVQPGDLDGYAQAHFFAGIGGWPLALGMAQWPTDAPVWTGSCPCQPFSQAGRGRGTRDSRHLWPVWAKLIEECRPATVFGEQVASPLGRAWLSTVRLEMEALGYGVGGADLCAAGVGAPHLRQRLWFVADAGSVRRHELEYTRTVACEAEEESQHELVIVPDSSVGRGSDGRSRLGHPDREPARGNGGAGAREEAQGSERGQAARGERDAPGTPGGDGGVGEPDRPGPLPGHQATETSGHRSPLVTASWADLDWLSCSDGKLRPTQPGLFPLADGVRGRVPVVRTEGPPGSEVSETRWVNRTGALKGAGNAIVPQVAAQFIAAYLDVLS